MQYVVTAIAAAVILAVVVRYGPRQATAYEFERGLKYTKGRFNRTLPPGQHWYWPLFSVIRKVDVRPRVTSIAGQEEV